MIPYPSHATSQQHREKKRKLLASYFVFFASPVACADHFEDHSNIKQNNYLVDIVA